MASCSDLLQIKLYFFVLNLADLKAKSRLFCSTLVSTLEARSEVADLGEFEDKYE